jgi:hypothetical protein
MTSYGYGWNPMILSQPSHVSRQYDISLADSDSWSASYITVVTYVQVVYPPTYPDTVPDLSLEAVEGELSSAEEAELLDGMRTLGEESLGMAMVFTLTSWLKEALSRVIHERVRSAKEIEDRKFAEAEEVCLI